MSKTHTFGARLKSLREKRGDTPEELAARAGVHPQTIRKYEGDERAWPRLDIAKKLASALGISLDVLAG